MAILNVAQAAAIGAVLGAPTQVDVTRGRMLEQRASFASPATNARAACAAAASLRTGAPQPLANVPQRKMSMPLAPKIGIADLDIVPLLVAGKNAGKMRSLPGTKIYRQLN